MARHNHVSLYGYVTQNPKIITDEDGNYLRGQCMITTIRGERSVEDGEMGDFRFDIPILMSRDPDLIAEIATWHEFDMVEVKGNISTKDVKKISTCPNCGHQNVKMGVLLYVTPIYCGIVEHGNSKEQCEKLLKKKCEISNFCLVAGNLCNNPEFYRYDNGGCQTIWQIAINRKFRVVQDPPEIKTDFPWVRSYGENAESDAKFLVKGASVLVEGFIQTRSFNQNITCEECGEVYQKPDRTMEIVPYSTEYLLGCRTTEEIEQMEKAAQDDAFNSIFGE